MKETKFQKLISPTEWEDIEFGQLKIRDVFRMVCDDKLVADKDGNGYFIAIGLPRVDEKGNKKINYKVFKCEED